MKMNLGAKIGNNLKGTMEKVKEMETNIGVYRMIPVNQINYNPKNRRKYSDDEISELATDIQENGLYHNIVVLQTGEDSFKLISGEKRTRAYKWISAEGETGFENIYAKILKDVNEVQEELMILQANQQATADDPEARAINAERINQLITTLIEQGQKFGSRRDMMAELSGKSGKQVERDLKLNKVIPELLTLAQEKGLAQSGIIEFADMPKDRQLQVYNMLKSSMETGSKPNREEIKEIAKQHKEEMKKLEDENKRLKGENQSLLKDKQTLEKRVEGMQKEINSLANEKGRLKSELMQKSSEIENINKSLEAEQKKNNPDKKEVERLQNELKKAQEDRETLNSQVKNKDTELQNKERELQEITNKANDVDNPLPRVQHNIELGLLLQDFENRLNQIQKKYELMKNDEKIGVNPLNEQRLMKIIEIVVKTVE